ncbi:MAG: rod shape-determining protein MreC [Patescibacteria group bacterium]|nr:rod shape-determining protein MreC [Patescibacteria group bacterium]
MLRKNSKKTIIIAAVVGLLIFFHALGFLNWLESGTGKILEPIFDSFYHASSFARTAYYNQKDKRSLQEDFNNLQIKVSQLIEENAKLKIAEEENRVLREHLFFLIKNDYNYIMSNVIAQGNIAGSIGVADSVIIDRGREDGLYPGLAVLSSQGTIVGKIAEVKTSIATVNLINSKKCKTAATILNTEKTSGITEGELGLAIKMNYIPQNVKLEKHDLVVTSGLEEYIPRGLVIGEIIEFEKESNDLWQNAIIEPIIDINNVIVVSVLLP